jgi:CRP/FNR family cyclic AMP-dependent transcriptional regulator
VGKEHGQDIESASHKVACLAAELPTLRSQCIGQFLTSLSHEMLLELEALTSFSHCAPGTVLFVEGQMPQEVFILLEGYAKLYMNSRYHKRLIVHIARAGEFLGLASAFTLTPLRTTAEASSPSRIASVRCADFLQYLLDYPCAAQAATRELAESCDRNITRLRTIGVTSSNRAKLARLLLEWCSQGKPTDHGIQIHLALKHAEIAECIGICRESINRILRDLQRWHVIEQHGSHLTILDFSALEQCAELK